jgi:hypothetical protein
MHRKSVDPRAVLSGTIAQALLAREPLLLSGAAEKLKTASLLPQPGGHKIAFAQTYSPKILLAPNWDGDRSHGY